jgi:adenylyltransferase/sulfurtransferase
VLIPVGAVSFRLSGWIQPRRWWSSQGGHALARLELLQSAGFRKVKNLKGGINAWAREVDPRLPIY